MKRSGASSGHRRAASDGASKAVAEAAAAEAAVPFLLQPEDEEDVVAESLARVRKPQERSAGAEQDVQGLRRTEEVEGREEGEDAEEEEGEVLSQTHSECDSTDYAAGDGSTAASPYDDANTSTQDVMQSPRGSRRSRFRSYFKRASGRSKLPTQPTHIFGVPLEVAVMRSRMGDNLELPAIFRRCIAFIEAHGLRHEGLYRLPGQKSRIEKLKALFDAQGDVELEQTLSSGQGEDLNVAASLLKLYLRELPDALLTEQLLPDFASVGRIENHATRTAGLRDLLCQLPMPNYLLMGWLVRHLAHVANNSTSNKMSLVNLYIVFGPTVQVSQNLMSHMLDNRDALFPDVNIVKAPRTAHVLSTAGDGAAADAGTGAGAGAGAPAQDGVLPVSSHSPSVRRRSRVSRLLHSRLVSGRRGSDGAGSGDEASRGPLEHHASASSDEGAKSKRKIKGKSKRKPKDKGADKATALRPQVVALGGATAVAAATAAAAPPVAAATEKSEGEMRAEGGDVEAQSARDHNELQLLMRQVTLLEKDLDLTRNDMARHDAIGQEFPPHLMEGFLERQRTLTDAKRRIKALRDRLGLQDTRGLSRSHMAAWLNQLYCSMLLQRLELLAVRDNLTTKLKREREACRRLEQAIEHGGPLSRVSSATRTSRIPSEQSSVSALPPSSFGQAQSHTLRISDADDPHSSHEEDVDQAVISLRRPQSGRGTRQARPKTIVDVNTGSAEKAPRLLAADMGLGVKANVEVEDGAKEAGEAEGAEAQAERAEAEANAAPNAEAVPDAETGPDAEDKAEAHSTPIPTPIAAASDDAASVDAPDGGAKVSAPDGKPVKVAGAGGTTASAAHHDGNSVAAALAKLEMVRELLLAEQELLRSEFSASSTALTLERQTCVENRVEMNMLWLERHPAALTTGAKRKPGAGEGVRATTTAALRTTYTPSAAEDENWAHSFYGRQWSYRCSEQRLPLNEAMGSDGRHIASAEPPQRPESLLDLAPFPSSGPVLETSSAWAPLTPSKLGARDFEYEATSLTEGEPDGLAAPRLSGGLSASSLAAAAEAAACEAPSRIAARSPSMASAAFAFDDLSESGSSMSSLTSADVLHSELATAVDPVVRVGRPGWTVMSTHEVVKLASSDEEGSV